MANEKPLWLESMLIRPQHFQQVERYLTGTVHARLSALDPFGWGLTKLIVDQTSLRLGKLVIKHIRGVMPDGTPFELTQEADLPPPREIPGDVFDRRVLLTLPLARPGTVQVQKADRKGVRYRPVEIGVQDIESREGQMAPISVGQPIFDLALDGDPVDGVTFLPVLRIQERRNTQEVILDDGYIPPLLDIHSNQHLLDTVADITALLHSRGDALAQRFDPNSLFGSSGLMDFALLQTVNRHEGLFRHLSKTPGRHPLELYTAMVVLAGELASFQVGAFRPGESPAYQHDDLRATFDPIVAVIRRALTAVIEQQAVPISLEARRFGVFVGQITDRTLLDSGQFVLAVNASLRADTVRSLFPTQVKIGPVEEIRQLVNLQLPGIVISPMAAAPRQIPFRTGFTYFELDKSNPLWEKLNVSAALALHVSGQFPGLEMELWAIRA